MFLLTNLVSSISKITQDLGNIVSVNTTVTGSSSIEGQISTSGLLSDTLSTVTNTLTTTTTGLVSDAVGTVTGSIGSTSPVDTVTNIIGGVTGGIDLGTSPIAPVIDVVQGGIDILQGVESLKLKSSTQVSTLLLILSLVFFLKLNTLFLKLLILAL